MTSTDVDLLDSGLLAVSGAGVFNVVIGNRWRDRLLARRCGHRRAGRVPVRLVVERSPTGQRWVRSIGEQQVTSIVSYAGGVIVEQVGRLRLTFQPTTADNSARLDLKGVALQLGPAVVRLPGWAMKAVPSVACQTRRTSTGLEVQVQFVTRAGHTILSYAGVLA